MTTSLHNFKTVFLQAVVDLLWRQWTTLGVAGHGERESRIIDPDALFVATSVFGRYEPRMFDEMLDWLALNGWCINVQRVRSLLKRYPSGSERVVGCVAALQAKGAETAKWRRLSAEGESVRRGTDLEPLFYLADGRPQPTFGKPEPDFARYGFYRGKLELRGMSQAPNPQLAGNLSFRLRALFGVNARAEVVAYLLTHPEGHPPEIARQTGFFPKTIQVMLTEMAHSGTVQAIRKGREKHYRMDAKDWRFLQPLSDAEKGWPGWVAWPQFFAAMTLIWWLAQNQKLARASAGLQAAEWQRVMGQIQPWLAQSNLDVVLKDTSRLAGTDYLRAVQGELLRLFSPKDS